VHATKLPKAPADGYPNFAAKPSQIGALELLHKIGSRVRIDPGYAPWESRIRETNVEF
jgi:hypothetical protein